MVTLIDLILYKAVGNGQPFFMLKILPEMHKILVR